MASRKGFNPDIQPDGFNGENLNSLFYSLLTCIGESIVCWQGEHRQIGLSADRERFLHLIIIF